MSVAIPIEKNFGSGPLAPPSAATHSVPPRSSLMKSFLHTKISSSLELEEDEIFDLPSEGDEEQNFDDVFANVPYADVPHGGGARDDGDGVGPANRKREISLSVSLALPFSREIAHARFSVLADQPLWSPWLRSVSYVDVDDAGRDVTEWVLKVPFGIKAAGWRSVGTVLEYPSLIGWETISGLKNFGTIEFLLPEEGDAAGTCDPGVICLDDDEFDRATTACVMKLTMSCIVPRPLAALFRRTPLSAENFLKNRLLRTSLVSFRDVVRSELEQQKAVEAEAEVA